MPDMASYPPSAFYFKVAFGGIKDRADASFQEVSGIGATFTMEVKKEGGENDLVYYLPKEVKFDPLVLKRGVTSLNSGLVSWCQDCMLNFRTQTSVEPKLVHVHLLNEDGNVLHAWSFANAIPIKWQMGAFNAQKNEVALETIELSYSYWTRER
jgi:phage tail-like protein